MTLRDLRLRARALLAPRTVERELDEELDFHLEMETRRQLAAGLPPDAAQARARARFGSKAVAAEECRDARGTSFIQSVMQDVSYAIRGFRRAPWVAATIVGTVALGRAHPRDCLRQRVQPAAGARPVAESRDRDPAVTRRVAAASDPATAHRERAACACRGRPRVSDLARRPYRRCAQRS